MIKFTIFLMLFICTGAVDFTAIATSFAPTADSKNLTVIYRSEFRQAGQMLVFEHCALEDCSDTLQS